MVYSKVERDALGAMANGASSATQRDAGTNRHAGVDCDRSVGIPGMPPRWISSACGAR